MICARKTSRCSVVGARTRASSTARSSPPASAGLSQLWEAFQWWIMNQPSVRPGTSTIFPNYSPVVKIAPKAPGVLQNPQKGNLITPAELLLVLDRPELPLDTNGSEKDIPLPSHQAQDQRRLRKAQFLIVACPGEGRERHRTGARAGHPMGRRAD
jgi:hypothetical protein